MTSLFSTALVAHRKRGNAHFAAGKYDEALSEYAKAMQATTDPAGTAVCQVNRALCYVRKGEWTQALGDAEAALAVEPANVKAVYVKALAMAELKRYDDAIAAFKQAIKLAQESPNTAVFVEDIAKKLLKTRQDKWEEQETNRLQQSSDLQSYMLRLIEEDRKKQLAAIAEEDNVQKATQEVNTAIDDRVAEVQKLFASADDAFKKRDVPEYLLGNIDFEIMRDPVIAPSGITYERSSILEHLHRVGHFDPITRSKLSEKQLISNLALKSVLDDFLDKNGWAADY